MSALAANPWPHVAFAALHLVAGQALAAGIFRARFGGSPLVLYRRGASTAHARRTRWVALATAAWAAAFLAAAFSARFRAGALGTPLFEVPAVVGWIAGGLGLLTMFAAQLNMGASFRVGLDEREAPALVTTGLHAWSRNPVYVGSFLYLAGVSLWAPCAAVLTALAATGAGMHGLVLAEERHLGRTIGAPFEAYRRRVRRYL